MTKIHPLLDPEKQRSAQNYETKKRKLSSVRLVSTFLLMLIFILFISRSLTEVLPQSLPLRFLFFIWILVLFTLPADLLFAYISGYRIEHEFGFSNQNRRQFFTDEAKAVAVSLILNPLLALVLFLTFHLSSEMWWLWAAGAMILVSGVFATLYPIVILPLFNKYTPVEDEELKKRLGRILHDAGLKIKGFYVQDMSKQTKKENAFLGGIGKTRRVVLSDNIINNMELDELETVIAHEVGHYKHKHIMKNIFAGALFQLLVFYLCHQIMLRIYPDYLTSFNSMLSAFPLFLLCFGALNMLIVSPLSNALSRANERQADRYALNATGRTDAFQRAMAGLANRNLSNAYPGPFIKYLYYSHPPVGERLAMAEEREELHTSSRINEDQETGT
ncbi:MAG: M48 family metallopeptidase [Candidatus Marinimicrobia bacterium]|nr:M48 family metallopeptidase [Candidatus Neomarinimicrobiota bacterium]